MALAINIVGNFLEVKTRTYTLRRSARENVLLTRPLLDHSPFINSYDYNGYYYYQVINFYSLAYSAIRDAIRAKMETGSGESKLESSENVEKQPRESANAKEDADVQGR